MLKHTEEEIEALQGVVKHYGLPVLLKEIDAIIDNVKGNLLSVPLDKDPDTAALTLLQERMKVDGAIAVRNALVAKIKAIKEMK